MKEVVSSPSGHVPGVDSFLDSFVNNYTNNEVFCGSFLTSLCKAYDGKVDGVPNLQYGKDILNFFLELYASGDQNEFDFVSGNFCGVSLRRMKKTALKIRSDLFIGLSRNEIIDLLLERISWIFTGKKDTKSRVSFTEVIDATDIVKAYQVSTSDHEFHSCQQFTERAYL